MKLTGYLYRELIPPLLAGVLLFTAILSFGYFFVSSQFLQGVPLGLVFKWIAYQIPDTLVKIFPMAVVLMTVVAFGRMATERELLAVQSGGLSLGRFARPAAVIAVVVSLLTLWLSLWVAPRANVETRSLYWDTLTGAGLQQLAGRTVDLGGNIDLNFAGWDAGAGLMRDIRVQQWRGQQASIIFATEGTFTGSTLTLRGYQVYNLNYAAVPALGQVPENDPAAFRAAVQNVFGASSIGPTPQASIEIDTGLSRKETLAKFADPIGADAAGWNSLTATLNDPKATPAQKQNARVTLNRKLALPFGNLVLVLAALPFALRYGRTVGVALGLALMIAIAYYLVFFIGLAVAGAVPALTELAIWLPNLLFAVIGLAMLRRA